MRTARCLGNRDLGPDFFDKSANENLKKLGASVIDNIALIEANALKAALDFAKRLRLKPPQPQPLLCEPLGGG
jgi:uncharacterized ferritin-like protein (DUF455 family)